MSNAPKLFEQTFAIDEVSANEASVGAVVASDPDSGDSLTFAIVGGDPTGAFAIDPATGEITVADATQLDFETTPFFALTVEVADSNGLTDTATITINLNDINDAPVAVDDGATTDEDTVLGVAPAGVLANDTDADAGDTRTVTAVNGSVANVGKQTTLGSGALLTLNADGSYAYDPNGQFEALQLGEHATDDFTYTVTDGQGTSASAARKAPPSSPRNRACRPLTSRADFVSGLLSR